jgi:MerR family redox-sensitive transcriptional activator SoxR
VAAQSDTPASTLRYYEDIGLIPPPRRESGQRVIDESILTRLAFIKVAQQIGFSLSEIDQRLNGAPSTNWRDLAQGKMAEIDAAIQRYETMKVLLHRGLTCGCIDLESCDLLK